MLGQTPNGAPWLQVIIIIAFFAVFIMPMAYIVIRDFVRIIRQAFFDDSTDFPNDALMTLGLSLRAAKEATPEKKYNHIAVDFDGTLCEELYPEIGAAKTKVIEWVKARAAEGSKIILWTSRENVKGGRAFLDEAEAWCKEHEIPIDAVNENPFSKYGYSRKVYVDVYLDNKSMNTSEIEERN
jgi:hypothetical protein